MLEHYTTIGVTGHIDHGKTSLVAALTGVDTDTHPEEKRRGITIDLGFASFSLGEHTFACIDAPGHQKYVGNLLAGVSAVDIGLLVVACDQGIQRQTLEHAGILKALGVPQLIVALSRVDLADQARREEVTEELEVFLSDFGFAEIPVLPVSTVTGEGIDALKEELLRRAGEKPKMVAEENSAFRLPIDRVLNVPGRGLVVAGTIWQGTVHIGDTVQVLGRQELLRVREIEVHGQHVLQAWAGLRTAINLTGNQSEAILRGDELHTPGAFHAQTLFVTEMEVAAEAPTLKCPATVQLHTATTACAARITGAKQLSPKCSLVVVVEPEKPIVATYNQACLFRLPYPVGSIGGGRVLTSLPAEYRTRRKRELVALGQQLIEHGPMDRMVDWIQFAGHSLPNAHWCESQLGISVDEFPRLSSAMSERDSVLQIGEAYFSSGLKDRAKQYVIKLIKAHAAESDDDWLVEQSVRKTASKTIPTPIVSLAIQELVQDQVIVSLNGMLAEASEKTLLSKKQRAKMELMLALYANNRLPPTTKETMAQLAISADAVNSLQRHAVHQRLLVDLGKGFFVASAVLKSLCDELKIQFEAKPELSVAEIKEAWGVTRKYAIPLLEFCDTQGITRRQQDVRRAGPKLVSSEYESLLGGWS